MILNLTLAQNTLTKKDGSKGS